MTRLSPQGQIPQILGYGPILHLGPPQPIQYGMQLLLAINFIDQPHMGNLWRMVASAQRLLFGVTVQLQLGRQGRTHHHAQRTHVIVRNPLPQPQLLRQDRLLRIDNPDNGFNMLIRWLLIMQPIDNARIELAGTKRYHHPHPHPQLRAQRLLHRKRHRWCGQRKDHIGIPYHTILQTPKQTSTGKNSPLCLHSFRSETKIAHFYHSYR